MSGKHSDCSMGSWRTSNKINLHCLLILLLDTCRILYFLPILHMAWEVTVSDMQ